MSDANLFTKQLMRAKRLKAQSIIGAATTAGVIIGLIPIPFSDTILLTKAEDMEVNSIASIYGIAKDDKSREFIKKIIEVATAGTVIKTATSTLKAIPGVNLSAGVVNAIIAGCIVAVIGESSILAFEQISTGKKTLDDLEWLQKLVESKFANRFFKSIYKSFGQISEHAGKEQIIQTIKDTFMMRTA